METRVDVLPGTLELIVLRALTTMGAQHAYGIAARIEQVAEEAIGSIRAPCIPRWSGWSRKAGSRGLADHGKQPRGEVLHDHEGRHTGLAEQTDWWQRSAAS